MDFCGESAGAYSLEDQDEVDKDELGPETNAVVWPRGRPVDEEDDESPENYTNQRFMRIGAYGAYTRLPCITHLFIGDALSDMEDPASSSSEDESESDSESGDDFDDHSSISGHSELSLALADAEDGGGLMADAEFRTEVAQSLERAFAEGHSVDNAAVELKTLRMASNVPLTRVKEAVVGAIVERIPVVENDVRAQRAAIGALVQRWGPLIDRIGGVDPVETVAILQVRCGDL